MEAAATTAEEAITEEATVAAAQRGVKRHMEGQQLPRECEAAATSAEETAAAAHECGAAAEKQQEQLARAKQQ